jgi:3-deoxy-D-manno-octulosonic-acid transferase
LAYLFYSFVLTAGFFLLSPRFLYDALTKGKYAAGFWQRFGRLPDFDAEGKTVVWLHCVSVGETQAAKPLVTEIRQNFPDYKLVVSTTTKTGQKLAREIFKKEAALVFYFPFDWRFVVKKVLRKIKPSIVLIMETELWFNFLREAKKQNAKIALVNGRLSEKSFKNYGFIRGLMRRVLSNLDLALMSGDADAARIVDLGCAPEKVSVTGNVKFDLAFEANELTEILRARFAFEKTRPLIVAASTHAPEERLVLEAFLKIRDGDAKPRLLLAPRHPERFDEVAAIAEKTDLKFARRSSKASAADVDADIILLDSIGELRAAYPLAEIVFMGGSLIPHGGQNVLEPAAARRAIVSGFYTMNFAAIVKSFREQNAIAQLPAIEATKIPENLAAIFKELLSDEARRKLMGENAFAVLQANRGATARTIAKIAPIFLSSDFKVSSSKSEITA